MSIIYSKNKFSEKNLNLIVSLKDYSNLGFAKEVKNLELFKGEKEEVFQSNEIKESSLIKTLFVGIGEGKCNEEIRKSLAKAVKLIKKDKTKDINVYLDFNKEDEELTKKVLVLFAEVFTMVTFKDTVSKTDVEEEKEFTAYVFTANEVNNGQEKLDYGVNIANGVNLAIKLVNAPPNDMYPEAFAKIAKETAKENGFEADVITYSKLQKMKAGLILAVGESSENKPCMVVMKYNGNGDAPYTALVGKGLTFDSGGYCLKSYPGIASMHTDMAGGAAMLGAITAIAKNKLKENVYAVVPLSENLIGETAVLPGAVATSLSGKTVEIANTDAEGRLILADALYYISQKEEVEKIFDMATLTGAAANAFGGICSAIVSNNDELYKQLEIGSIKSGEKIARMPLFDEYRDSLKSLKADYKNLGNIKGGGIMTAAAFLEKFVNEKAWVHVDIAGVAFSETEKTYTEPGATGYGVKLMYYMLTKEF